VSILDHRFTRILDVSKREFVQARDSNIDHIMRLKGR
jgi:hypothetical protein